MEQSKNIAALAKALCKAQSEMKPALKDSVNPFFKSKYADLASVSEAVIPLLSRNGMCVIQTTDKEADGVTLVTTLAHESGQWIRGRLFMRPTKNDPQGIGSCLTYQRRYALAAIVGLTSEEDDDGNAASRREEKLAPNPPMGSPHEDSPKTKAAKDPANSKYAGGKWKDVVVHFGKNEGKKLGELDNKSLHWWRVEWKPKIFKGIIDEKSSELRHALDVAHFEHEKAKAEHHQEHPPEGAPKFKEDMYEKDQEF